MNKKTLINHLQSLIDVLEDDNTILEHAEIQNNKSNEVTRAHADTIMDFGSKTEAEDFRIEFQVEYGIPEKTT